MSSIFKQVLSVFVLIASVGSATAQSVPVDFSPTGIRFNFSDVSKLIPDHKKVKAYYGEISRETGRSKTVRVRPYYRRDGTYVPEHYRSTPRKHYNY